MENKDKPAHPASITNCKPGNKPRTYHYSGLTKREYFAIESLKGILANSANNDTDIMGVNGSIERGFIACNMAVKEAISYADELLKQLES